MTREMHMGSVGISWNRGFVEVPADEAHPQQHPSGGEGSSSHQAPLEWDTYSAFQGL